jgi:hypothetical protein
MISNVFLLLQFLKRMSRSLHLFIFILSILPIVSAASTDSQHKNISNPNPPDFMKIVVTTEDPPQSKSDIAFNDIYKLNEGMFPIYEKSLSMYKKHFLARHNLIMGLFSGEGGRFILYQKGKPPLEADPVPAIYRMAKAVAHSAMATYELAAPYTANAALDLSWKADMQIYHVYVLNALQALDAANLPKEDRELMRDTLEQVNAFINKCLKNNTFSYQDLQSYAYKIQPNLAKLITLASTTQVTHWFTVLEQWKKMLGKEWDNTYALSNSIYVTRQNNILFSVLAQFMGETTINDRLILLETTDFTATPEAMMDIFIRIISDRTLGKVFFNNYRLMDYEVLGEDARKIIEMEDTKRGMKVILPPLVPFNSTEWPWKINPASGSGPATMKEAGSSF